ncbi:MAG: hypothetical protein KI791_17570 [Cyclobacteriaceae bacterium]|nr:hypothetical protein [Cyclobacteriaceae bacterium SS2]
MKFNIVLHVFSVLLIALLLPGCNTEAKQESDQKPIVQSYTYQDLSGYQRTLLDGFIENIFPSEASLDQVMGDEVSIRSITRLAMALLFRNENGDHENAIEILEWVLQQQHQDENEKIYGAWKTAVVNDKLDHNWREFVGCDLIIISYHYKDVLPDELQLKIKEGLIHAAKGAMRRDVTPQYTNISVMSAFLMNHVGTLLDIQELREAGMKKARDINTLFQSHNTFSEFNSPTYDGVSLVGFAMWRELSQGEMRAMGIDLEQALWREIANHYNPTLKNFTGPYFRAYGMDVNKYVSITSLWIAIALNDEALAPLPKDKGAKYFEVSNLAPIYHLGLSISESTLNALKSPPNSKFITQQIPNNIFKGDSIKEATIRMNENWMMGGLRGNLRSWNQVYTGTIHWKGRNGEVEWLLIPGTGLTNVAVSDSLMRVYAVSPDKELFEEWELKLYIYSTELSEENFSGAVWRSGNMQFNIRTDLIYKYAEIVNPSPKNTQSSISEYYPKVAEISFQVPSNWKTEDPLVEIRPQYENSQTP